MKRSLLVTGASTGFGRAIALASRDRGDETYGTVRSARDAEALQAEGVIPVHRHGHGGRPGPLAGSLCGGT